MSSLAATVQAMAAAGCTADQIAAVVAKIDEDRRSKSRAGNAERQRRFRTRNANNGVTGRDEALQRVTDPLPSPPNDITLTPLNPSPSSLRSDREPVPRKSTPVADEARTILAEVVSEKTAADVVAHRKALKSPMTAGSAKGLAKAFAAYGDPEAAAHAMMANGWRGFDAAWMQARAGPSAKPRGPTMAEMARMDDPEFFNDPRNQHGDVAPKTAGAADAGRSGFAGRLSVQAGPHAGRRLVDL